jgi:hypothetical protein
MTPRTTTTHLILATLTLVGLMTTGAIVPSAIAQTADPLNGITDQPETTRETTDQNLNQSEQNRQSNSLNQDQTSAINEETASGEGSSAASAASSDSESTYKTKYKSNHGGPSTSNPGESTAVSDSTSDVSNTATIEDEQTLSSPVQVNDNNFGNDQSRNAAVGFDLVFEQFTEETESATPDIGSNIPIQVP